MQLIPLNTLLLNCFKYFKTKKEAKERILKVTSLLP